MTIGTYAAKTNLPRLLAQVEKGETITITRHGRPVAKIVPVSGQARRQQSVKDIVEAFRLLRASVRRRRPTIRELIDAGRRR